MGTHINADGEFQSDKYPGCPPGKVPLSVRDPLAQDLLWTYAERHRAAEKDADAEFSRDLQEALTAAGYVRPLSHDSLLVVAKDVLRLMGEGSEHEASCAAATLASLVIATSERGALPDFPPPPPPPPTKVTSAAGDTVLVAGVDLVVNGERQHVEYPGSVQPGEFLEACATELATAAGAQLQRIAALCAPIGVLTRRAYLLQLRAVNAELGALCELLRPLTCASASGGEQRETQEIACCAPDGIDQEAEAWWQKSEQLQRNLSVKHASLHAYRSGACRHGAALITEGSAPDSLRCSECGTGIYAGPWYRASGNQFVRHIRYGCSCDGSPAVPANFLPIESPSPPPPKMAHATALIAALETAPSREAQVNVLAGELEATWLSGWQSKRELSGALPNFPPPPPPTTVAPETVARPAPWLDRLPTPEEVASHAKTHPANPGENLGYWLRFRNTPMIVLLGVSSGRVCDWSDTPIDSQHRAHEGARWLPCTAEGIPVYLLPSPHDYTVKHFPASLCGKPWTPGTLPDFPPPPPPPPTLVEAAARGLYESERALPPWSSLAAEHRRPREDQMRRLLSSLDRLEECSSPTLRAAALAATKGWTAGQSYGLGLREEAVTWLARWQAQAGPGHPLGEAVQKALDALQSALPDFPPPPPPPPPRVTSAEEEYEREQEAMHRRLAERIERRRRSQGDRTPEQVAQRLFSASDGIFLHEVRGDADLSYAVGTIQARIAEALRAERDATEELKRRLGQQLPPPRTTPAAVQKALQSALPDFPPPPPPPPTKLDEESWRQLAIPLVIGDASATAGRPAPGQCCAGCGDELDGDLYRAGARELCAECACGWAMRQAVDRASRLDPTARRLVQLARELWQSPAPGGGTDWKYLAVALAVSTGDVLPGRPTGQKCSKCGDELGQELYYPAIGDHAPTVDCEPPSPLCARCACNWATGLALGRALERRAPRPDPIDPQPGGHRAG